MSDPSRTKYAASPRTPGKAIQEVDTLLRNITWLLPCAEGSRAIPNGAVAIRGKEVAAVGTTEQVSSVCSGQNEVDLSGFLVMPGLVNTHAHAAMSCFRGLADDLPLGRWLNEIIFPAEAAHVNPDMVYWGTLLSIVEMLKNGITTFCDGYFFEEEAARAALDGGMRAVLGQGILDFPTPDQPDPTRSQRRAEAFLASFPRGVDRLRPSIFCHTPTTCCPDTLVRFKALCREHGLLFQIHLSETASEPREIAGKYGCLPVHHLDRLGILDDRTLCVHGIWLEPSEMEVLTARGAGLSHNPESSMKLASGVAPVPRLLAGGLQVGLGTDGCASNNDLDLFSEMSRAGKLHKVFQADPVVCPADLLLSMATRMGAAVIGWDKEIGTLEVGKKADLIALDLNQPHLTPLYDPVSHLVYAAAGSDVRHVWVDGEQVVRDGRTTRVDEALVMEQVNRIAGRIRAGTDQRTPHPIMGSRP